MTDFRDTPKKLLPHKADYEVSGLSYSEIADRYGAKKTTVRYWVKTYGWTKSKTAPLVQEKVNAIKKIAEINEKTAQECSEVQDQFNNSVKNKLEMEGIYGNFEKELMTIATNIVRNINEKDETATNKVVHLSTAYKNMRPQQPVAQVNVQNNTKNNVNITIDERRENLKNLLDSVGVVQ